MPPKKNWEDNSLSEDSNSDTSEVPKVLAAVSRRKFDDEEGDDSDVLDSWDAAEDSEVEREKAKKAAEAKAKAEAEAKANKKSRVERIALRQAERKAALDAGDSESDNDETEQQKRDRLRRAQKEADLRHAEDLFGDVGSISGRKGNTAAAAVIVDPSNPNATVDLSSLPLFNPKTKTQLEKMGQVISPLLAQNHKMPAYIPFVQELCKALAKELPSEQVKKIASTLTAISNERMRAEKAGEKTGKKKGKAKTSLVTTRNNTEDVQSYGDEAFGDDDFM